ncbi:MAG TPA: bacillithiol system redox-active protein YtxJ [Bacteroidia bacterium]|jgi:bacillithiol system protein YtxJ|nr:bacillithiol system redox-active protein YtxJ [Bacteroidia bacterium]HMU19650.1 bacillithiol system redox-active protein YtxJ [Bacteroidia bacterium]
MEFKILESNTQLIDIETESETKRQVIFKHSTRCSLSAFAKKVLLSEFSEELGDEFDVYYLDLLNNRMLSNTIAKRYEVQHESPQILILDRGKCIYHASHNEVSLTDAKASIQK